jgi:hypothetical protein
MSEGGLNLAAAAEACGRLDPPVEVDDLGGIATCLRRLISEDVMHLIATVDQPRALEALVCMGLEEDLPAVFRSDPATCDGSGGSVSPSPTPTPTPHMPQPTPTEPGQAPTPTPQASATPPPSSTPAPTPTGAPTASPTPAGQSCTTVSATLTLDFDTGGGTTIVNGIEAELKYPQTLDVPGFGSDATVLGSVANLTGVSDGVFSAADSDANQDGMDDLISVGLVRISLTNSLPPGSYARVKLSCREGATVPNASAFTCTPDVTDVNGLPVTATCSVSVSTP